MTDEDVDDPAQAATPAWLVLVNKAGQHCIWPVLRPVPAGWTETGPEGDRATCLEWIERHGAGLGPADVR